MPASCKPIEANAGAQGLKVYAAPKQLVEADKLLRSLLFSRHGESKERRAAALQHAVSDPTQPPQQSKGPKRSYPDVD
eukprot:4489765-Amphidinium_carterae.4